MIEKITGEFIEELEKLEKLPQTTLTKSLELINDVIADYDRINVLDDMRHIHIKNGEFNLAELNFKISLEHYKTIYENVKTLEHITGINYWY